MTLQEEIIAIDEEIRDLFNKRKELYFKLMLGHTSSTQAVPDNVVQFPIKQPARDLLSR